MLSLSLCLCCQNQKAWKMCFSPSKWLDVVWYKIIPEPTETCRISATKYFQMPELLRTLYPIYFSRSFQPIFEPSLFSGKRKCLGETVAKTTLCLFLANIVKNFKLVKVDNVPLPDPEPLGGLTLMPRDFQFKMEAINSSVSW